MVDASNEFLNLDVSDIIEFLSVLENIDYEAHHEIMLTGMKSLDVYDQIIKTEVPVNFGHLKNSFQKTVTGSPEGIRGEIYTDLIYGWPVERGRRPGKMPPVAPLAMWFIRKGIATRESALKAAWGLAVAISKGDSFHQLWGGSRMVQTAFEQGSPIVQQLWRETAQKIVNRLAK